MIELRNLSKSFVTADGPVDALKNVSLTINNGDIYGIIGMSGAGKSTLVRCINMLERPTDGAVLLDGRDLSTLKKKELRQVRAAMEAEAGLDSDNWLKKTCAWRVRRCGRSATCAKR